MNLGFDFRHRQLKDGQGEVVLKLFLFITLSLGPRLGQGATQNECTNSIFNIDDWSQISGTTMACLNTRTHFSDGVSVLCEPDKRNLSVMYSRYLELESKYNEAKAALDAMPDPSSAAEIEVEQALQNWEILGHRVQVETIIGELQQQLALCSGN